MRIRENGFTLIELMIVVAIIAILAAIAFPAYQDYVVRTQVSEGVGLSVVAGTQSEIVEFYDDHGRLPTSPVSIGVPSGASVVGTFVSRVDMGTLAGGPGLVMVTFSSTSPQRANMAINGATIQFSPITGAGSMKWVCRSGAVNGVLPRYLPKICRP